MSESSADEIREWLNNYLKYARVAYQCMLDNVRPSSDYIVDGNKKADAIVNKILEVIFQNAQ